MYVLLAAFCCAIMVFVVSCVVYASKYQPIITNVRTGLEPTDTVKFRFHVLHDPQKIREPTTNVHEWVWLGRAAADSTPSCSSNVRITANPLNTNYSEPEDCLTTNFGNSYPVLFHNTRMGPKTNSERYFATSIGFKGDVNNSADQVVTVWNKPSSPIQICSHAEKSPKTQLEKSTDGYRPPVPPHRNIEVLTGTDFHLIEKPGTSSVINKWTNNNRLSSESELPTYADAVHILGGNCKKKLEDYSDSQENVKQNEKEFVHYWSSTFSKGNQSRFEVKTANIVENSMFSVDDKNIEIQKPDELTSLEELQLEMDYQQIQNYFENLKESNA